MDYYHYVKEEKEKEWKEKGEEKTLIVIFNERSYAGKEQISLKT